jgi:hypothetical protein
MSVPDQHRLKIAKRTLELSDVGALILGGMTKDEARQVIIELTGKDVTMNNTINVGDRVRLTKKESIKHFQSVGMTISGTVVVIEKGYFKNRIYGIQFPDREGTWHYRRDEIKKESK